MEIERSCSWTRRGCARNPKFTIRWSSTALLALCERFPGPTSCSSSWTCRVSPRVRRRGLRRSRESARRRSWWSSTNGIWWRIPRRRGRPSRKSSRGSIHSSSTRRGSTSRRRRARGSRRSFPRASVSTRSTPASSRLPCQRGGADSTPPDLDRDRISPRRVALRPLDRPRSRRESQNGGQPEHRSHECIPRAGRALGNPGLPPRRGEGVPRRARDASPGAGVRTDRVARCASRGGARCRRGRDPRTHLHSLAGLPWRPRCRHEPRRVPRHRSLPDALRVRTLDSTRAPDAASLGRIDRCGRGVSVPRLLPPARRFPPRDAHGDRFARLPPRDRAPQGEHRTAPPGDRAADPRPQGRSRRARRAARRRHDMKIGILGGGGWGTTLALLLDSRDHEVRLWVYEADETERMRRTRENTTFLPGVRIPDRILITNSQSEAVRNAEAIVIATPSRVVRDVARKLLEDAGPELKGIQAIVSGSKGLEPK